MYRAKDLRLKREVAIKILPDEFSRDPERASRFQREAEALAALNHQNIAGIYDLQQSEATRFLVLELVEGDTLADMIKKRGALPVDEAFTPRGLAQRVFSQPPRLSTSRLRPVRSSPRRSAKKHSALC